MFRRLMVIGLLGISALVFAAMFDTSTAEARRGCRGRRVYRSNANYAPARYYQPRVAVGVGFGTGFYGGGFYGGGFGGGHGYGGGHGFGGGHGGFGGGHGGHGGFGGGHGGGHGGH